MSVSLRRGCRASAALLFAVAACSGAGAPSPSDGAAPLPPPVDGATASVTPPPPGRDRPAGVPVAGSDRCRPPQERVWQLSPLQLASAVGQVAPGIDARGVEARLARYAAVGAPFSNDPQILNASPLFATELVGVIRDAAEALAKSPAMLDPCLPAATAPGCIEGLVDRLGRSVLRRPVAREHRDALVAYHREIAGKHGAQTALVALLRRLLAAPDALFRSEVGALDPATGVARLTPFEVADLVAFTLTDAPPDAGLRAAADDGSLTDKAVLATHVRRLLAEAPAAQDVVEASTGAPRRITGLMRFFREWLDVDRTRFASRPKLGGSEERVLRWLDNEPMMFLRHALWQDGGRLSRLLSADYTIYSNTLASIYGLPAGMYEGPMPTQQGRRGLLMQAGFLTGHDSATDRGLFIRNRLFCQIIPAPPNVDMNLEGLKAEAEAQEKRKIDPREIRRRHMADPACAGCHQQLDPLGFPFDAFDEVGAVRETWDGFRIDTAGEILGTQRTDGKVTNAVDLVSKVAASPDVRDCFVQQLYAFVHGRRPGEEDTCYLDRLRERFASSQGDVRDLLAEMLVGDETLTRTPLWEKK